MGVMSQLDMERTEELNRLHVEYLERFQDILDYQAAHSVLWRSPAEDAEVSRLEAICGRAKFAYEKAKRGRYTI